MIEKLKNLVRSKVFWENFIIILIGVIIYVGFRIIIQSYYIDGPSMEPTYQYNERLWVLKLEYKWHDPQRGDVIVFQQPNVSTTPLIKRVIGLPGETVVIQNGIVSIHKTDGSIIILQEPYINGPFPTTYNSGVIPADSYFVMGDNRNNSMDSRYGWFVARDKIIGKAWVSYWPPGLWGGSQDYRQPATVAAASH
jgi:signal peptidase I